MVDPHLALQQMLQTGASLKATLFPQTSRYHGIDTAILKTPEGKQVIYLMRRFVPAPERFELVQEHVVVQGERLDNLTAHYLGDPEQFWRVCDANNAMRPAELEETGRWLRITLPDGIPVSRRPHA